MVTVSRVMPLWQSRFVVPGAAVELFLAELDDAAPVHCGLRGTSMTPASARSGGSS